MFICLHIIHLRLYVRLDVLIMYGIHKDRETIEDMADEIS